MVAFSEPSRFGVGDVAELPRDSAHYLRLLALDSANLQPLVLWTFQDLVAM